VKLVVDQTALTSAGGLFGIGRTSAIFQTFEQTPCWVLVLDIAHTGSHSNDA